MIAPVRRRARRPRIPHRARPAAEGCRPALRRPRRTSVVAGVLAAVVSVLSWSCATPTTSRSPHPSPTATSPASAIPTTSPSIISADVRARVEALSSPRMLGRDSPGEGGARAARQVAASYRALGLEPLGDADGADPLGGYLSAFARGGRPPGPGEEDRHGRIDNVLGRLRGRDGDRIVVVGAHYDALGVVDGQPLPGADDNASGVAALLEIAEALSAGPAPCHQVVFAAFGSEEDGLWGSRAFVERPPVPLERIGAMINLDMVGRPANRRLRIVGWEVHDRLAEIVGRAVGDAGVVAVGGDPGLWRRSDHYPFSRAGIPAVWLFGDLHDDYHDRGDLPERLDYAFLVAVTRGLTALLRSPLLDTLDAGAPIRAAGSCAAPGAGR